MSKMSAKARLECLRGWRRAMKIVTKEEKAYQASQKRKAKKEKNFS